MARFSPPVRRRSYRLPALSLLTLALNVGTVRAATYYVAPEGKDGATGTTPDAPLRSFHPISELAKPGDTFIVAGGTYDFGTAYPSLRCAGAAEAPIRIVAAPGVRPLLRFAGWSGLFVGPGAAHLELAGFDIEGTSATITLDEATAAADSKRTPRFNGSGISIDGRRAEAEGKPRPHHITVRDMRIWGCPGNGACAIQSDYVTFEDNTISGCAWYSRYACSGISVWQAWNYDDAPGHHILVRRNRCFDNQQFLPANPGGHRTDGNGIIIDDGRNTQGGSTLGPYRGRVLVEGNVCFNNGGSGIHTYKSDGVDVLNNVLWMNNRTPEQAAGQFFANNSTDIRIEGNVFGAPDGKAASSEIAPKDGPPLEKIVWRNNLYLRGAPRKADPSDLVVKLPTPTTRPAEPTADRR